MIDYQAEYEDIFDGNDKETEIQSISMLDFLKYVSFCISQKYKDSILLKDVHTNKVSIADIAMFCKMFAVLSSSGLSVSECMNVIEKQIQNEIFRKIINKVYDTVQRGGNLSKAMESYKEFPKFLVYMIKASEVSGQVEETFKNMSIYYERQNSLIRKVRAALFYPAFVSVCAIVLIVILLIKVLPEFVNMFSTMGAKLPSYTMYIISISSTLSEFWPVIIIIITLLIFFLKKYTDTDEGRYFFSKLLLKLPGIGPFIKISVSSKFSGILSMLLKNGVNIIQALDILKDSIDNQAVSKCILSCRNDVEQGHSLHDALAYTGVFPEMLVSMVSVGEECGTLPDVLNCISTYYEEYVENSAGRISSIIEPIIMIILGVIVCSIIMSVMLPMLDMYKMIN